MFRFIKGLAVASAVAFLVIIPSVSASAATGPSPSPCNNSCAPSLQPKDPSQDVTPPQGTKVEQACDPSDPCTPIPDPAGDSSAYDQYLDDLQDAQYAADNRAQLLSGVVIVESIFLLLTSTSVLLLLSVNKRERRRGKEAESASTVVGPTFH